ncbi:ROK family protein (plasmid) [Deinococcus taeanensis]|uniref:ROK family protein n=1 Tax=Deinococcus taeanensis TaxID=2737050 RepID=UPI001CDD1278|nr:ROK family protein [Deinococcus taeanensis]UBV44596.1 ROK family protein [Deinococcus taeanensis]
MSGLPSPPRPVIGIDMGGTKVAAGVVDRGRVLHRLEAATPAQADLLIDLLGQMVRRLEADAGSGPLPIGLGAPGPVTGGQTTYFSNIPGLSHTRLEDQLARVLNRPVPVENDANLAALAEHRYGASRGTANSVYLTWSTGIGCGLILGGALYPGRIGMAGEVGHTRMDFHGTMDGSGTRGTLEAQACGAALARDATFVYGRAVSVPDIFERARGGDPKAQGLVDNAAAHMGLFLHNLQLLLDPDVIVLGGGLMAQADTILPMLETARRQTGALSDFTPLVLAALGADAGLVGAAELARTQAPPPPSVS